MVSKLKGIQPKTAKPGKAKILIFGEWGTQKTWQALEFPAPYYFDVEGGADREAYTDKLEASKGLYVGPEQGAQDFGEVLEQVKGLATEKHPYKTVVFDSITKLFSLEVARENERILEAGKKDEFGTSRKPAVRYMQRLVAWLQRMDMNCVLIAHSKSEWGRDDRTGDRVEVGKTYDCWDKLSYELDLTLETFKQGGAYKARVRKTRLPGFKDGEIFTWSYPEFAKRYGENNINEEVSSITLPTEEQLTELYGLMVQKKVTDAQKEKVLNASKVTSFEEMEQDKVVKLIDDLKKKSE